MPDPFDPRFTEAADKMARNAAARFAGDPWLIGYFVENELSSGRGSPAKPEEHSALAINTLAAGQASPGTFGLCRSPAPDLSRVAAARDPNLAVLRGL